MSVRRSSLKPLGSTPDSERNASLWSDNPAQRIPSWQHNAAMIYLHCVGQPFGQAFAFNKRASTGGAPVRLGGLGQYRVALAADSLHAMSLSHGRSRMPLVPLVDSLLWPRRFGAAFRTLEVCTLQFDWWRSIWTALCCRPFHNP
jgi:hypothetical protein